jgi:hypothetical protein
MIMNEFSDRSWAQHILREQPEFLHIFFEYIENVHVRSWLLRKIELHTRYLLGKPIVFDHLTELLLHLLIF